MESKEWFYSIDDQRKGPVTESRIMDLLENGTLLQSDLVWKKGMPEWISLSDCSLFSSTQANPPPLPRTKSSARYSSDNDVDEDSEYRRFIGKKLAAGLCGILVGGFGVHKFILGFTTSAVIMLSVGIVSFVTGFCILLPWVFWMAVWVIGLVEGILYLTKTDREFYQRYAIEKREWF